MRGILANFLFVYKYSFLNTSYEIESTDKKIITL